MGETESPQVAEPPRPEWYAGFQELRKAIRRHQKEMSSSAEDRVSFEQALLDWSRSQHADWLREHGFVEAAPPREEP